MRKDGRFLRQVVPLCKAQVVFLTRAKSSDLTTVRKIPKIYVTLFNCSHQIYFAPKPQISLEMIFLSDSSNRLLEITMSHFIILLYFTWKQGLINTCGLSRLHNSLLFGYLVYIQNTIERNRVKIIFFCFLFRDIYLFNSICQLSSSILIRASVAFKTWCGHQYRVGIICPPG